MSRISEAFAKRKKTLITFVTGGDPSVQVTKDIVLKMIEGGAGLVEIGIPFSDPIAEGPVICAANERALSSGCTTDDLFDMVRELREKTDVPIVFLTYINPIYTYGKDRFFKRCKECMVDGVIVPDLPFEERDEIEEYCEKYAVDHIVLVAPTSRERISMIAKEAKGYVYCVSSMGVTGMRTNIDSHVGDVVATIKKATDTPCAIGFGISDPEQAGRMASLSDGAIIGSAIVKIVEQYGENSPQKVYEFVKSITDYDKEFLAFGE